MMSKSHHKLARPAGQVRQKGQGSGGGSRQRSRSREGGGNGKGKGKGKGKDKGKGKGKGSQGQCWDDHKKYGSWREEKSDWGDSGWNGGGQSDSSWYWKSDDKSYYSYDAAKGRGRQGGFGTWAYNKGIEDGYGRRDWEYEE